MSNFPTTTFQAQLPSDAGPGWSSYYGGYEARARYEVDAKAIYGPVQTAWRRDVCWPARELAHGNGPCNLSPVEKKYLGKHLLLDGREAVVVGLAPRPKQLHIMFLEDQTFSLMFYDAPNSFSSTTCWLLLNDRDNKNDTTILDLQEFTS